MGPACRGWRLLCDNLPEFAGRTIDDLADIVAETGKEGIDIVTRSGALKEFWEIKYVLDAANAIGERQIEKHLRTKILGEFEILLRKLPRNEAIAAMQRQVQSRHHLAECISGGKE